MQVISQFTPIHYKMKQWFIKEIHLSINVDILELQMFKKQLRLIKESRSRCFSLFSSRLKNVLLYRISGILGPTKSFDNITMVLPLKLPELQDYQTLIR